MEDKNSLTDADQSSGPKYNSARFWINRANHYEKQFKKHHWKEAAKAWKEYTLWTEADDGDNSGGEEGTGEHPQEHATFPIFWSSVKTLAPAYYSKTPIPIAPVRFGLKDTVARTSAKLMERLGIYSLETTSFDQVMRDLSMEYILAGMAIPRVMLEGEQQHREFPITADEANPDRYLMEDGTEYQGEMVGEAEGYDGMFGREAYWGNVKCYPMALSFDDVMWTPTASCYEEIDEIMYRFCYPEHEAYKMFPGIPEEDLKPLMVSYGAHVDKKQSSDRPKDTDSGEELYLHGWEIWDKVNKQIRFIHTSYKQDFLKVSDDKYQLRNFYPSPCPILATKKRKKMFAIPGYKYLKPITDEMHDVAQRVYNLSQAIRPRFVVDKAHETDLMRIIQDGDESEYMFIKDLADIVEKGGLPNVIQALPVGELSQALIQLSQLFEKYKQEFYEIYGVPDVLRGASDPLETAKAQEIKSFAASNRFRDEMNQIANLGRDLLEMMIDLKLGAYDQGYIYRVCAVNFMDELYTPDGQLDPAGQQRIDQAYNLLLDDQDRLVRIDFETDSTSYINEAINQQNRNVAIQTVTQGLGAMKDLEPHEMVIGFKTIQAALSGMRMGKEFMDEMDELTEQAIQMAQNPPEPGPDIQQMLLNQQAQDNQIKAMQKERELTQKEAKMIGDHQIKQMELAQKERDTRVKEFEAASKKQTEDYKVQLDAIRVNIEKVTSDFMMELEKSRLSTEQFSAISQAMESQREEVRLANESMLNMVQAIKDFEMNREQPTINIPEMKPAQIELVMPEKKAGRRRRKVTPIDDGVGNVTYVIDEEEVS